MGENSILCPSGRNSIVCLYGSISISQLTWFLKSSTTRSGFNLSTPWLDPNFSTPWSDPNLSTPWSDPNFSTPWSDLNWIFFKIFQILRPSILGMTSSTLKPHFLSGVYYDNGDCHILCVNCTNWLHTWTFNPNSSKPNQTEWKWKMIEIKIMKHDWNKKKSFFNYITYTHPHIYIWVSWPNIVDSDSKASFSIAATLRWIGGRYSFLWIIPLALDPYFLMLSVKQVGFLLLDWSLYQS